METICQPKYVAPKINNAFWDINNVSMTYFKPFSYIINASYSLNLYFVSITF